MDSASTGFETSAHQSKATDTTIAILVEEDLAIKRVFMTAHEVKDRFDIVPMCVAWVTRSRNMNHEVAIMGPPSNRRGKPKKV